MLIIPFRSETDQYTLGARKSTKIISRYLSEVPARIDDQDGVIVSLREIIKTPLILSMREPRVKVVDFGVGMLTTGSRLRITTDTFHSVLDRSSSL